ncbi:MAG TPA: hypothetical protein VMF29_05330, partial [Candidatus Edwardsbacteria bacterium]|nr:hypothetical protein [Candidatus Edwardsbacteria bacterium]
LLKLTQQLVGARGIDEIARIAVAHLSGFFGTSVCIYVSENEQALPAGPHPASSYRPGEKEFGVASWVFQNRQAAGKFTQTLAGVDAQFLPVSMGPDVFGVIGIDLAGLQTLSFQQETLLNGAVQQITTAIERVRLIDGKAAQL